MISWFRIGVLSFNVKGLKCRRFSPGERFDVGLLTCAFDVRERLVYVSSRRMKADMFFYESEDVKIESIDIVLPAIYSSFVSKLPLLHFLFYDA